jgi:hypothetical protein
VVDGCGILVCGMVGCDMVCVVVDVVGGGVVGFWVGVDWGGGGVVLGGGVVVVLVCVLVGGCDVVLVVVVFFHQFLLPSEFPMRFGCLFYPTKSYFPIIILFHVDFLLS